MKEKYLPIGSVVLLKDATKKVMITGFCMVTEEDGKKKMFDYSACIFPEGIIDSNQIALFNHDQIDKICFEGYRNEETEELQKKIKDVIEKQSETDKPKVENSELEILDTDN